MTPNRAPNAPAIAASAWQAGCFAEFGAAIMRRKEKREKRAAMMSPKEDVYNAPKRVHCTKKRTA